MRVTVTNDENLLEDAAEMIDESSADRSDIDSQLSLEDQLAAAQAEAARNLDGWQRTQAEFANARKRFEKQRVETYQNANAALVAKLLPLIDDFERALETPSNHRADDPWVAGVSLVYRKMLAILEEMNVQPIPAVGEVFDPNLHEALSQEPSDEYESGTVVREVRRGYRLGDQVIRPSLVTVAP
jgi:molecular chaperone GrpE